MQFYRQLIQNLPFVVFTSKRENFFAFDFISNVIEKWTGISKNQFLKDKELFKLLIYPEDRKRVISFLENKVVSNPPNKELKISYRISHTNGAIKWIEHTIYLAKDDKQVVSILRDITKEREVELVNKKSEERYKLFFEKGPLGIILIDRDGIVVDCNDRYLQLIGSKRENIIGLNALAISNPPLKDFAQEVLKGKEVALRSNYIIKPTKKCVSISLNAFPIYNDKDEILGAYALIEDISHKVALEKELLRQRDFNKATIETIGILVAEIDDNGLIFRANSVFRNFLGCSSEELYKRDLFRFLYPESNTRVKRVVEKAIFSGEKLSVDAYLKDRYGKRRLISFTINPFFVFEENKARHLIIGNDITVQRELEERLREVQKMEAIGRLAGGVAHDFNNQLTAIMGYCQMMLNELDPNDDLYKKIQVINRAAKKASNTTNKLLAFSKKQALNPQKFSLNQLVQDACIFLRQFIGEDIKVEFFPGERDCTIEFDHGRFLQIFLNLALNSKDAMEKDGIIKISTDVILSESSSRAIIKFEDNGCGIAKEILDKVFEPFFTTKPLGKGAGLGLAVVYGTVKQSGGEVSIESQLGKGTSVTISLPVVPEMDASDDEATISFDSVGKNKLVLLIEDEPIVQETITLYFKKLGFDVIAFENAQGVISYLNENLDIKPDMVITDVVMPGLNGFELIEELKKRFEDLKAIVMSGYNIDGMKESKDLNHKDEIAFLQKPFGLNDLIKVLQLLF